MREKILRALTFIPRKLYWRFFDKINLRAVRRHIRFPGLWARACGKAAPKAAHASRRSRLDRPESVSVSASGEKLVVSNSHGRNIAVYSFAGSRPADLGVKLTHAIADENLFHYAHGAIFGVTDEIVLAVGEYSNSLSAIDISLKPRSPRQSRILWTVSGRDYGLDNPADIALHPGGEWMVVTNRMSLGICILCISDDADRAPPVLSHSMGVSLLNSYGLAAPHGVAISPDGLYMFVTHKRFYQATGDTGNSAISIFSAEATCPSSGNWEPIGIKDYKSSALHHIACHPFRDMIAITNSLGDVEILNWDRETNVLETIDSIDVFRLGEGAKGISFVKNGTHLAITTELDEILFYEVEEYFGEG